MHEVRARVVEARDGPELWFYIPWRGPKKKSSGQGQYLTAVPGKPNCYALDLNYGIMAIDAEDDVLTLKKIPFEVTVASNNKGKKRKKKVTSTVMARAFTDEELSPAYSALKEYIQSTREKQSP